MTDSPPKATFKLPDELPFGKIRRARTVARPTSLLPPLDPLSALSGEFVGNAFSTIFRANSTDNSPDMYLTSETLSFSKRLGTVHGAMTNGAESVAIHCEPGIWIHVTATNISPVGASVARVASIPYGTTIEAQGHVDPAKPGKPVIGPINLTPISKPSRATAAIPQHLGPFVTDGLITQALLDDPNSLLRDRIAKQNILDTSTIFISAPTPTPDATHMSAVFWIETVQEVLEVFALRKGESFSIKATPTVAGQHVPTFCGTAPFDCEKPRKLTVTFTQIQYTQSILQISAGLSRPHVSVNTLVPADRVIVPASAWA